MNWRNVFHPVSEPAVVARDCGACAPAGRFLTRRDCGACAPAGRFLTRGRGRAAVFAMNAADNYRDNYAKDS